MQSSLRQQGGGRRRDKGSDEIGQSKNTVYSRIALNYKCFYYEYNRGKKNETRESRRVEHWQGGSFQ